MLSHFTDRNFFIDRGHFCVYNITRYSLHMYLIHRNLFCDEVWSRANFFLTLRQSISTLATFYTAH